MPQYDYNKIFTFLETKGKQDFGKHFRLHENDLLIIKKVCAYFLKDELVCSQQNIYLHKGILLAGSIGCGKTSLMNLMRYLNDKQSIYLVKPCRDIAFEFIQNGYEVIQKYSRQSFYKDVPKHFCFDDLGTENNLKYYGNECNVMAEILLSRYDLFVSHQLITHITTNLAASEIEQMYGNRVRSRMRELFNLIAFDNTSEDKRK
ncbi:MAG: ATPase [Bacteroidia bacterium]|nr:ATPase [Bacteroidia bacterium]